MQIIYPWPTIARSMIGELYRKIGPKGRMTGYLQDKDFTEICNDLEYSSSGERRFLKVTAHPLSKDIQWVEYEPDWTKGS